MTVRARGLGGGGCGSSGSSSASAVSATGSSTGSAGSSAGSSGSSMGGSITGGSTASIGSRIVLGLFLLPGGRPRPLFIGGSPAGVTGIGSPSGTKAIAIFNSKCFVVSRSKARKIMGGREGPHYSLGSRWAKINIPEHQNQSAVSNKLRPDYSLSPLRLSPGEWYACNHVMSAIGVLGARRRQPPRAKE